MPDYRSNVDLTRLPRPEKWARADLNLRISVESQTG
jgi:hypothetical protein